MMPPCFFSMTTALSLPMGGSSAWNAASAAARGLSAIGHLADGDAAPLKLQLHRPQRGQHRHLGVSQGPCRSHAAVGWRVPVGGAFPGAREILSVEAADAVVVPLGTGLAFCAAVVQDLCLAVAG